MQEHIAVFQYRTRDNSSPRGKRRVYFSSHPDDFEASFDVIARELLSYADCAVWYADGEKYEDIETDLGQMNLFVIPVTNTLLSTQNRTVRIDIPFAKAHMIPILPVMQEEGLDSLYAGVFGELHYLSRVSDDKTALSFQDKMHKYLSQVLIGDEMVAKVRAAFDAYIFMSYRKKDRKYANELMRLIHRNDFCRDIAIWYDEYLVPGENFNEAISDAIRRSELFAMVVTPNLVNEANYVQKTEYPAALEMNKKILMAELEQTDHELLADKYSRCPECVDARDRTQLSDSLIRALSAAAKKEANNDPEHMFFIGLAYLEGIDVEKDSGRALSLFSAAAEAGIPEAAEKLVWMYMRNYGDHADRNLIKWQRWLADHYERLYADNSLQETADKLINTLKDLVDSYFYRGFISDAEAACLQLEQACLSVKEKNGEYIHTLCDCYERMGDIFGEKGDRSRAEEILTKRLELAETLLGESEKPEDRALVIRSLEQMGNFRLEREDRDGAQEYYQKAIDMCELLVSDAGRSKDRRILQVLCDHMGSICYHRKDFERSEKYYERALELAEALWEENRTLQAYRDRYTSVIGLGDVCYGSRKLGKAEKYYLKALDMNAFYRVRSSALQCRIDQRDILDRIGNIYAVRGDFSKAESWFDTAIEVMEKLAKQTDMATVGQRLAASYEKMRNLYIVWEKPEKAEEYARKADSVRAKQ